MNRTHPRLRVIFRALCVFAVFQLAVTAATAEETWQIGPRTLKAPAGASMELQEILKSEPQPNAAIRGMMAPASAEAWKGIIQMRDQQELIPLDVLQEDFGVTIERDTIEGVPVFRVTPNEIAPQHRNHLFLHVHGGGYIFFGGDNAVGEAAIISGAVGIPSISIDYRMPPDHPFPAAVDDVLAVYRSLLQKRHPAGIALGGTSAGGGLALASVHRFIAEGVEIPGAIFAGTPWADLTPTGDSISVNEGIDHTLVTYEGMLGAIAHLYAGGADLTNPLISPVYGEFEGFPPTYLITGTRDLFLSDTARTHRKLRQAGAVADLNVFEGLSHADYIIFRDIPESEEFLQDLGDFLETHLLKRHRRSRR